MPRSSQPELSQERIVAEAVRFADSEGLAKLSMARLAERLGCATMSLYRHVATKDDLLVFMLDHAYGKPPFPEAPVENWRAGLERWTTELLAVYRRHPWMLQIPTAGPPLEPGQLSWMECGLQMLRRTGLSPTEKFSAVLLMTGYVHAGTKLSPEALRMPDGDGAAMPQYGRVLAKLVDADHFPVLSELITAGVIDAPTDEFAFGLQRVLDGVEVMVNARQESPEAS
ncbi:TetR/AcrR family transcriptional regulator [Streptomyces sp. NBC_01180]|uniref:TetR/AcrR family transcriptional regulator n=1 Tax=Streptomyces sp. NBC_01180 TaxID=2903763 RepID=UPI00386EDDFD|nr:TetR/AcrR family transcriptional regulator [Streptomyces sp. NBC_01180]